MNPLRVALFSPVLFIPGIFLRYLPFKSVVKKGQKLALTLLYILALILNGAVYFLWGKANGGLSMSFLKTDMIIFALVLTGVNMLVIKGKIKEHLFTYGLSMLLNYMNLTFSSFFSVLISPEKINKTVLSIGIYFILYIIFFPMFLKLLKITITPFISIDSGDYWNTIWFVPIAMFLACYFTIFGENTVETLPQVIGRLFLLVSAVFMCRSVAKDHMRMTKQLQTEKQLNMQTEYYNELSEQVEKARKSRHDMKHNMAAIQRYIDSDDKEGLQEYCYDFSAEQSETVIPYTGNPAADGVLYHYSKIAKENGIRFEMKGTIKSKGIADVDLCDNCGQYFGDADADNHSFNNYEEVEAPKCGVAGKEVSYCDNGCGATDEKEIPALTHEPLDAVAENEVNATCKADGSYDLVVYCDLCGEELSSEHVITEKLPHTPSGWWAMTETEHYKHCVNDSCSEEIEGTRAVHTYTWKVTTEATATTDGMETGTCVCGYEITRVIPATGETPDPEPGTPDEPTDDTCDHLCHSNSAFVQFFWKIIRFLQTLFGIQQYCDCGVAHW